MTTKLQKTVFITGASGFVGSNITRAFVAQGYDVHILLRSTTNAWRLTDIIPQVTVHIGTLLAFETLHTILHTIQPTIIIHLATHGAYATQNNIDSIVATNIEGTKNLLQATRDIPYTCFINTGSSSEYGKKENPMHETDSCEPTSYYAATKLAATHLCRIFALTHNKPIVTLRLFSVFGPYEEPTRLIPTIMQNLLHKKIIHLTPASERRDFIYITDVIAAYMQTLAFQQNIQGEIINIGSGKEFTNDEVVSHLFAVTNQSTIINKGGYPARLWDTAHWVANIDKAKRILNWQPIYDIDKALSLTYAWYESKQAYYENP